MAGRSSYAVSDSPLRLRGWTSVSDLINSACCFTASWRESSSVACFCEVAYRKLLVELIDSLNLARELLILSITLLMT